MKPKDIDRFSDRLIARRAIHAQGGKSTAYMKGTSLPIETIVIIALAALVLIVVAAMVISQGGGGITYIEHQRAMTQGCSVLSLNYNCDINEFANIRISGYKGSCGGSTGTLAAACCALKYEYQDISKDTHCAYTSCKCINLNDILPPPLGPQ